MKTKVITYFIIMLIFNSFQLFTQDEFLSLNFGDVIQSPNAASFTKYGYTPVSTYTGIPKISIPVWDLKAGDIEMPISLSYHAGGIKVEDIASWVGLGWNLNVGGVITRQVKELPDFEYRPMNKFDYNSVVQDEDVSFSHFERKVDRYTKDAQPDIFTYNFNGYVGQFIKDSYNGTCILLNNNRNLKIEYKFDNGNVYFEVTTPNGILYQFKDTETQEVWVKTLLTKNEDPKVWLGMGDYKYECVSAWYLTKIKSCKTGHTISFDYDDQYEEITVYSEPTAYYYYPYDLRINPSTSTKRCTQGVVMQSNLRLTNITTSNNTSINFIPKTRKDLYPGGGKALSRINVKYDGNNIRSFLFNHDYFCVEGKNVSNAYPYELRLKLSSFCELGNLDSKPCYEFDYNETHKLPPRNNIPFFPMEFDDDERYMGSYAKDFLGYYNGKKDNTTFKEKLKLEYLQRSYTLYIFSLNPIKVTEDKYRTRYVQYTDTNIVYISEPGADKSPSLEHCQAYTLNEITYPTGAKTQYSYELHDYSHIGTEYKGKDLDFPGLRIKDIKNIHPDGSIENHRTFYYNELYEDNTNTDISSGALVKEINQHQETWIIKHYNNTDGGYADVQEGRTYVNMSNKGMRDVYDYTGGFIGYSTVKEDLNGNGFIIYHYMNSNTSLCSDYFLSKLIKYYNSSGTEIKGKYILPFPNESFSEGWISFVNRRGLLTNKIYLDNDLYPEKEERNVYRYIDNEDVYYGMERYIINKEDPSFFLLNLYSFSSRFSELSSTSTKYYHKNASGYRTSSRNFEENYLYNDYGQISKKTFYNSTDPKKTVTYYKYASDYDNLNMDNAQYSPYAEGIKTMKENNYINKPLEIINKTKSGDEEKVIGAKFYNYKKKTINSQTDEYIITLDESKTLEISSPVISGFNHSKIVYNDVLNKYTIDIDDMYKHENTYQTNRFGNVIQVRKKNGSFTSFLWAYKNTYPIAKVNDAEYTDIFHTSFEDTDHPNVKLDVHAKTGKKVCEIPPSSFWPANIDMGRIHFNREYIFQGSFKTSNQFTGSAAMVIKVWGQSFNLMDWLPVYITNTQGEWKQYQLEINTDDYKGLGWIELEIYNPNGNEFILVDEVRFHPANAQMNTYTYDPLIGMTSETDANNQTTYYLYDGLGRLQYIKDNEKNILEKYDYHYANQEDIEIYDCEDVAVEVENDANYMYRVNFLVTGLDEGTGCICTIDYGDGSPVENIGSTPQYHEYPDNKTYTATFNFFNAYNQLKKTITKEISPSENVTAEVENHTYYIHRVNFLVTGIEEGSNFYCKINYGDGSPIENIGTTPQYHTYPDDNTYTATFNFYNIYDQLVKTITREVTPPADENPVIPEIVKITDDAENNININKFIFDGSGTSHIRIYLNLPINGSGCSYPINFQVIGFDSYYENERVVYEENTYESREYLSVYRSNIIDNERDETTRYYFKIKNKPGCDYLDQEIRIPDCVMNYYNCGFVFIP